MVLYSLGPECMHFYVSFISIMIACMHFYVKVCVWGCCVAVLCVLWFFCGCSLGLLWGVSGAFLGHLGWDSLGTLWGLFLLLLWVALGSSRLHSNESMVFASVWPTSKKTEFGTIPFFWTLAKGSQKQCKNEHTQKKGQTT